MRFDDPKLGLVLTKLLKVGREIATIQSVCTSVLPAEATSMLKRGDQLVSVNGSAVRKMTFSEQLQQIKGGKRPIWLGFATMANA